MKFRISNTQTNIGSKWFADRFDNKTIDLRGQNLNQLSLLGDEVDLEVKSAVFGEKGILINGFAMDRQLRVGGRVSFEAYSAV